jgi:hypothetical protein
MKIDLERSITRERLVESDISNERRFEIIFSYFFGLMFTLVPLSLSVFFLTHAPLTIVSTLTVIVLLVIGLISLYGLLFKDKLLSINGTEDREVNKSLIKEILKEVFVKNTFIDTGNIWSSRAFDKVSIRGKRNNRLTIIFNKDSIYCNGELIGRREIHSTYHSLFYLLKFIKVRNKFDRKIAEILRQKRT